MGLVFFFFFFFFFLLLLLVSGAFVDGARRLENKGEIICIPNATFHIDCNRCKCSPTGMSIDCTDWTCATLQISHDLLLNITLPCRAGDVFLLNDLKCLCSSTNAKALCSSARRELAHNLRPAKRGSILTAVQSPDNCTPGIVFKNDCNTCICSEDGRSAACLALGCFDQRDGRVEARCNYPGELPDKICVPNSIFSVDCNRCSCGDDGFSWSCERYPCLGVEIRDDQILNITFRCERERRFRYNRHDCLCSKSGKSALCSLARLPAESPRGGATSVKVFSIAEFRELCTPGLLFKDECNVCICGRDEAAACTRLDCRELEKRMRDESVGGSAGGNVGIVTKEDLWVQRRKNRKFCKEHYASMYCRFLRDF